jgi:hypothetical protein
MPRIIRPIYAETEAETTGATITLSWRARMQVSSRLFGCCLLLSNHLAVSQAQDMEITYSIPPKLPRRNLSFTGRIDELARIHEVLDGSGSDWSDQRVMVLYGLGGMGKTELALQYAYQHLKEYTSVWWISVPAISQGFVGIAQALVQHHAQRVARTGQPDYSRIASMLGLPLDTVTENGQFKASEEAVAGVVEAVKGWLAADDNKRWLMIMDNHDDLEVDVEEYLPAGMTGSILITSRAPDSARLGTGSLEVEGIREEDAIEILRKSARKDTASFENRKCSCFY